MTPSFSLMNSIPTARIATNEDEESLWGILEPMVRRGGTYVFSLDKSKESLMGYWMGTDKSTFLVERDGELLGTFYLKSNQEGLGDHICNAGFVVAPEVEGQGLGRWMGTIALEEAKKRAEQALDQTLSSFDASLANSSEVAFFPPMTGG